MHEQIVTRAWRQAAIAWAVAATALIAVRPAWALSFAAGGAWNLASLFCLAHMLKAWLGPMPSQRRAIGAHAHGSRSQQILERLREVVQQQDATHGHPGD